MAAQDLVMIKSVDLEKGEKGQHCFSWDHEPLSLGMKGILGSGRFGQVDRVLSLIGFENMHQSEHREAPSSVSE